MEAIRKNENGKWLKDYYNTGGFFEVILSDNEALHVPMNITQH